MVTLHIQHAVPDFDAWKRAFDGDPMDRKGAGVRRYHVHRALDEPGFVLIDLEFDTAEQARQMLERLRRLWTGPGGAVMRNPSAWVVETVDTQAI